MGSVPGRSQRVLLGYNVTVPEEQSGDHEPPPPVTGLRPGDCSTSGTSKPRRWGRSCPAVGMGPSRDPITPAGRADPTPDVLGCRRGNVREQSGVPVAGEGTVLPERQETEVKREGAHGRPRKFKCENLRGCSQTRHGGDKVSELGASHPYPRPRPDAEESKCRESS